MNFGAMPPEVNSGRMYSGAGSGPLLAAAAAWEGLAAEVASAANGCQSVISGLVSSAWSGPSSASMVAAVAPYVAWLGATAARCEQTGLHARAAAAAYETAFAMTVPPPVIAANRALLMALIATNFFGQNTPAIAATEAQYAEFWAQDAAAMYGYAGSSAIAAQLTPFAPPPPPTTPPSRNHTLGEHFPLLSTTAWEALSTFESLFYDATGFVLNAGQVAQAMIFPPAPAPAAATALPSLVRAGQGPGPIAVSAGIGTAARVGLMSTPPSWTGPPSAPKANITTVSRSVFAAAPKGDASGLLRGIPTRRGAPATHYAHRQYGFPVSVVPRPPAGG
ncbi:PPE family protein [Mycobacterium angelicum]|uniref:PPE family protein n=1 Tax=Mycobacterium angelicum TaxID=470074 RepID=A0A1W9ZWK3_MYCAN|nr:PPE family protein [Mycobacterium angelicum]MCV7199742.1 PPE family protein [Mycobacterium angelicum]ORA22192.1 hypothetical protein BST12_10370 [Mycobacterium angelicum]